MLSTTTDMLNPATILRKAWRPSGSAAYLRICYTGHARHCDVLTCCRCLAAIEYSAIPDIFVIWLITRMMRTYWF